jgi:cell division protein FtsA
MLPAGVIFVGGGAELEGLVEAAKKKLRLPAAVGQAKNISVVIDKVKNPEFLTALGLVIWGSHSDQETAGNFKMPKGLGAIATRAKGLWQKIMPK